MFDKGSTVYLSADQGSQGHQTYPLGSGTLDDALSFLSLPGKTLPGDPSPYICQFDVDVRGLVEAPTYYLTVVSASGLVTPQFAVPRYEGGDQKPFEVTVDPATTSVTTTSAPPLETVIKVTGTGPANSITIDQGGAETQHTDASLPYSITLQGAPLNVTMEAQDGSGESSATITCEIDDGQGDQVSVNTSTGPYAVVQCSSSVP
jgi:hypothetical protein